MTQRVPNVTVRMRCSVCGHEQDVTSATAVKIENEVHYFFGSKYDFCDKCDGPLTQIEAKKA